MPPPLVLATIPLTPGSSGQLPQIGKGSGALAVGSYLQGDKSMDVPKRLIVASSRRETGEREILQQDKEASGTSSSLFDRGQGFLKRTDSGELIIDPGEVAGWIFTYEEKGERIKD